MKKQIFVNLPVKDLGKTRTFFTKLGYGFNEKFSDEKALCMVVSEEIFVMLLVEEFFATFTKKPLVDAKKSVEVLIALSSESRAAVDELVGKALTAGGIGAPAGSGLRLDAQPRLRGPRWAYLGDRIYGARVRRGTA